MIKTIRRGAAALLAAIVLTGSLTGCGTWSNTKIVLTTGLTGAQLFKVGKSVCTLPEAMIYVMDYKQQYENAYGVEMWEHDFGGVTLEEYVKDTIIAQLASVKAVTLLAKENNVTLSDAEKEKISQAAEEYYSALTDEQKKYMKVEKSDVEDLYAAHVLSKKVYTEITKDVNTEVSDDEARIITIQQIRLDSLDNAESVKARLDEGKDFGAAYPPVCGGFAGSSLDGGPVDSEKGSKPEAESPHPAGRGAGPLRGVLHRLESVGSECAAGRSPVHSRHRRRLCFKRSERERHGLSLHLSPSGRTGPSGGNRVPHLWL